MWDRVDNRARARDVAVIDVGSNSVRLVLYRVEGRAIWTLFNEKVLAGLGRDLARTGRLEPEGVTRAVSALKRFRAVLDAAKPSELFTAATAAVRDASDGADFIEQVRRETGLAIRVLSGVEDAHYAAMGVAAGAVDPQGVVGDLGGSSLELTRLVDGQARDGVTLPLGPFSLGAPDPLNIPEIQAVCRAKFETLKTRFRTDAFFAVGGAWRNMAKAM